MQIFFALWGFIFVGIIVMIIKGKGGSGKTTKPHTTTKQSLDNDMFTDPTWRGFSSNINN